MLIPVILAFLAAVAFSRSFCIEEVENSTADPYITYSLQRTVEKAFLENGYELSCEGNPHKVRIRISSFEETPIAYTPAQRVSSYNLILRAEVRINGKSISIGGAVPYTLPSGGYGDLPRRKAVDDLLDKIYLDLLGKVKSLMEDEP